MTYFHHWTFHNWAWIVLMLGASAAFIGDFFTARADSRPGQSDYGEDGITRAIGELGLFVIGVILVLVLLAWIVGYAIIYG